MGDVLFGHGVSSEELKETMSRFLKKLDEDKLRMAVKLLGLWWE